MEVTIYGQNTDFGFVCTVTLTLKTLPLVKVMTHSFVMEIIVWNIIVIGQEARN